ncbi:protein-export chaperone SecB [Desulfobacter curvatus]|uniref:protein-export chaperone SecB n=1 Tax=Desulfobacter curvatus TaxID=2290 RepID=UPI0003641773|nr:protein-export chaperone SecB [Desulfobacter curvatus]
MGVGSIKSEFDFISYKVDRLEYSLKPDINLLEYTEYLPSEEWNIQIAIRQPSYFSDKAIYVAGLDVNIELSNENTDEKLITLSAGVAGMFKVPGERFPQEVEEQIVKNHFPVLLLPYLRSTISSLLANAGIVPFIFPLINLHKLAEHTDISINVIEAGNN